MALLFQSNPDQWDLRGSIEPGEKVSWFVTRYLNFMRPSVLTLLWEAQGSKAPGVRGLYGWGVTLGEAMPDRQGRLRIPLQYVERWIAKSDADENVSDIEHIAAVPAQDILLLSSWQDHLLATMPIGTNFIVTPSQILELSESIVRPRFPDSEFPRAARMDSEGVPLVVENFSKQRLVEV